MKKLMILMIALCCTITLHGEELEMLIGAERAALLLADESITELQLKNPVPKLIPNKLGVQNIIQDVQNSFAPNLMVESLFLYKKPAGAHQGSWTEAERTAVYNSSLALSSLAGIEYYSTSRRTMRTFYETSSIIDNPENKNPQRDPVYRIPPKDLTLYARQKDLTFGDNIYQYTYHTEDDFLVFIQENLTAMNKGIIPAVGRNKLRSAVAIINAGEYLLVYAVSMADTIMLPGISQRVGQSFSTRAEAILHWFSSQADKAFQSSGQNL